jgi:hypothetical protein
MESKRLIGTFRCRSCNNLWDGSELLLRAKPAASNYEPTRWEWGCGFLFCGSQIEKVKDEPLSADKRENRHPPPRRPIAYI